MNPLAWPFATAVAMRNWMYDRGLLASRRLTRPVISVGNISVGGTGKTPFVIMLGELLRSRGLRFTVLSRGYGRSSANTAVVDPQGSVDEFGDEPLLMARRLQAPVVVGADRHAAGMLAEQRSDPQFHLLDDGFQHRRLARDFDIVLLAPGDLEDALLPVGRLREPIASLHRADAIVLPAGVSAERVPAELRQRVWRMRRELELPSEVPRRPLAFCGIARPEQFFAALREKGVSLVGTLAFRDHQRYGEGELRRLRDARRQHGATGFITTEKDWVRLGTAAAELQPLGVAGLRLELEDPASALEQMLRTISKRRGTPP